MKRKKHVSDRRNLFTMTKNGRNKKRIYCGYRVSGDNETTGQENSEDKILAMNRKYQDANEVELKSFGEIAV